MTFLGLPNAFKSRHSGPTIPVDNLTNTVSYLALQAKLTEAIDGVTGVERAVEKLRTAADATEKVKLHLDAQNAILDPSATSLVPMTVDLGLGPKRLDTRNKDTQD